MQTMRYWKWNESVEIGRVLVGFQKYEYCRGKVMDADGAELDCLGEPCPGGVILAVDVIIRCYDDGKVN